MELGFSLNHSLNRMNKQGQIRETEMILKSNGSVGKLSKAQLLVAEESNAFVMRRSAVRVRLVAL